MVARLLPQRGADMAKLGSRGYRKNDIDTHYSHGCGARRVSVNVKDPWRWSTPEWFDNRPAAERDSITAQITADTVEQFWEEAQQVCDEVFGVVKYGSGIGRSIWKVSSQGRSGGHLVVVNAERSSSDEFTAEYMENYWNGADVARWGRFERAIKALLNAYTSQAHVTEMLDDWLWREAEEAAELAAAEQHRINSCQIALDLGEKLTAVLEKQGFTIADAA